MDTSQLLHFTSQAITLVLYLSLPAIAAATLVGLLVGLFQALTSIQEQTLPHGFKLVAVIFALALTIQWFGPELYKYAIQIFDQISQIRIKK